MIMIISKSYAIARTAREILFGMGYLTDTATPLQAALSITERHRAVILLGRDSSASSEMTVRAIRLISGNIPIAAIREDITDVSAGLFDLFYPNSVYSTMMIKELKAIAEERGIPPIGEYRIGVLDASVELASPRLNGNNLGLTRTEAMILRTIICHPDGTSAADILYHAFRLGRSPSEAGVRTHLSTINRKLSDSGVKIVSAQTGYLLTGAGLFDAVTV